LLPDAPVADPLAPPVVAKPFGVRRDCCQPRRASTAPIQHSVAKPLGSEGIGTWSGTDGIHEFVEVAKPFGVRRDCYHRPWSHAAAAREVAKPFGVRRDCYTSVPDDREPRSVAWLNLLGSEGIVTRHHGQSVLAGSQWLNLLGSEGIVTSGHPRPCCPPRQWLNLLGSEGIVTALPGGRAHRLSLVAKPFGVRRDCYGFRPERPIRNRPCG
jgi:hypothetical protein